MDAGALDRRLTILRATTTEGDFGNEEGWATYATRWASREDVSDGEKSNAGLSYGTLQTRFQVRYDSKTKAVTASDRVRCEGVTYDVIGVKQATYVSRTGARRQVLDRHQLIEITARARND
jgi:SPP1 family predicted phage head-tail adaptor